MSCFCQPCTAILHACAIQAPPSLVRASTACTRFGLSSRSANRRGTCAQASPSPVDRAAHNQLQAEMFGQRDIIQRLLEPLPQEIEQVSARMPVPVSTSSHNTPYLTISPWICGIALVWWFRYRHMGSHCYPPNQHPNNSWLCTLSQVARMS